MLSTKGTQTTALPKAITKVLNSQACHGNAIMSLTSSKLCLFGEKNFVPLLKFLVFCLFYLFILTFIICTERPYMMTRWHAWGKISVLKCKGGSAQCAPFKASQGFFSLFKVQFDLEIHCPQKNV